MAQHAVDMGIRLEIGNFGAWIGELQSILKPPLGIGVLPNCQKSLSSATGIYASRILPCAPAEAGGHGSDNAMADPAGRPVQSGRDFRLPRPRALNSVGPGRSTSPRHHPLTPPPSLGGGVRVSSRSSSRPFHYSAPAAGPA